MELFGSSSGILRLYRLQSRVRVRAGFRSFLSTEVLRQPADKGWTDTLYNRVVLVADPKISVVPVLDRWVEEGKPVEKKDLQAMVKQMRDFKRYPHALEISMWMSDRRYFSLTPGDLSYRLQLINKVHGLEHAENYFNNIPKQLKLYQPYGALLSCYAEEKSVEKTEALFDKMKEANMLTSFAYNILMKLYSEIRDLGKVEAAFQEMEGKGIRPDLFSYDILMEAYANASNIKGMEQILKKIKDPRVPTNWHIYAVAAKGYLKAGIMDKALEALGKSEKQIPQKKGRVAYGFILSLYADIGNKDELYRVWNACKSREKLSNSLYMCMISALLKLDDIEGAEAILKEWEDQFNFYDFRVPNLLIAAYCRKGLLGKAESLVTEAIENGRTPYANTWDRLAGGYFREGQPLKAVEMMKKAVQQTGQSVWKPDPANVLASLEYFRDQKDVEAAEQFVKMFRHLCNLTKENYHCLLRTYLLAGKPVTYLLEQMKQDGLNADDETQKILEEENNQSHPESSLSQE